ncbi:hypothetical protein UPYG_G00064470 [Umbra pygmaea]|uniref:PH domain-containing protein n=1 Tax=Umbra pygmaea TaxID=75934 RepID=A0ABD0XA38_UMBPY
MDNVNEPTDRNSKTNHSPPQGSWRGSSHSLLSPAPSHSSSPPRLGVDTQLIANSLKPHATIAETDNRPIGDRNKSAIRRGLEYLLTREEPPRTASVDSQGMTIEDYVILADIPRPDKGSDGEEGGLVLGQRRRAQSPSPRRDQAQRTPRYTEESRGYSMRAECDERGRGRERGRDRREKERTTYGDSEDGRSSPPSSTVLHPRNSDHRTEKGHRSSKPRETVQSGIMPPQPGQKGWISKLDEYGEWRRHWFVMRDTALSFYRDSEAEESHDLDGEIDLTDCVDVLDLDVEKNYGFQIYTKKAVFTLSASTSRIRKSWVKVLRRTIQQPRRSPNNPQDSVSNRKGLGHCSPPHQPLSGVPRKTSDPLCPDSTFSARHTDSVDSDRAFPDMLSASQREAGEGWDREQAKRLEERNKWFEEEIPFSDGVSRWESLQLKTAGVPAPVTHTMDVDVSKKWAELESLSYREMTERSCIGAQTNPTNEIVQTITTTSATDLQREALPLKQQVKLLRKEQVTMGMEVDSPCGPGAPCGKRLDAMKVAHHRALQDLQESHAREVEELQRQRDGLLQEESQATTQVVEALKKAHKAELEIEVETARRMAGGQTHVDTTYRGQTAQADAFHKELEALSERYTQKCLELSRAEQSGKDREAELNRMEKELEHLRKENQELQARLTEEISRMRSFITGQSSGCVSPGNSERSPSELEILLHSKDNEVEYLQREITCLRNEVQSLTLEKQTACERYKEVYVELSEMKGRSELETREVKEHLGLANAARHDGIRDT